MGLIQREIESVGISTIGISIVRSFTEKIKPPRTLFLDWPFGHPLGQPFNVAQQRSVMMAAFRALYSIRNPCEIVDLRSRFKGEEYGADKLDYRDYSGFQFDLYIQEKKGSPNEARAR